MDGAALDVGLLALRVCVGLPFALHGFQKLLGWFGGAGPASTAAWFASIGFGSGRAAMLLAGAGEVLGGVGLALGFLTPLAASAVVGTMTTAALVNNASSGFWSVAKGWELNGYLIVVATALALTGPGPLSLDAVLDIPARTGLPLAGAPALVPVVVGAVVGWLRWITRRRPD